MPTARAAPLVLASLIALALLAAGCTKAPTGGAADDGDTGAAPAEPGPFHGVAPGVAPVQLGAPGAAAITGTVYDTTTGHVVPDAIITITCARGALPATSESLKSDDEGTFGIAAIAALTGCLSLDYEVDAAGYTLVLPLSSPPLGDGKGYIVLAGLRPA